MSEAELQAPSIPRAVSPWGEPHYAIVLLCSCLQNKILGVPGLFLLNLAHELGHGDRMV